MLYVFVVIEHGTRRLAHVNVTTHPSAAWTLQQLREVIADADAHKYLIHDRDSIFARHLDDSIRAFGLAVLRSPFSSPKANAICERVIGTIRRECLDWMIPLSEAHLRSILREWVVHYNGGVRTTRWDPAYPALPQGLHAPRRPNPDVDGRRVRSCARNPCWAACTTSTRFRGRRRSCRALLGLCSDDERRPDGIFAEHRRVGQRCAAHRTPAHTKLQEKAPGDEKAAGNAAQRRNRP